MGWCKELVWLNSTANCKPAADPVVTRRPCWKDQSFVLPGRSLPFLKLKFWVSVLYWSWSMTWWWRHAPRSPQLTLSYKNTLQVTQHGLSLNAEDEQAWPNLYGQQSHSLKFTLQKMQARAPQQPAAGKPFRATLKITLSGITTTMSMRTKGQLQLNPVTLQGSFTYCKCCSAVLNFSRKSLHTAMPRGLQWQKVHLKSCALIQQVTSAGEYFPLLQPPRNTRPGIEAQEERGNMTVPISCWQSSSSTSWCAADAKCCFATYLQLTVFIHSQVTWLQVLQQTRAEKLDVSNCNTSTKLSTEPLLAFDGVP